jgi:hypothetical protein
VVDLPESPGVESLGLDCASSLEFSSVEVCKKRYNHVTKDWEDWEGK